MGDGKKQVVTASEIAKNGMAWINSGKVRNHKLGNSSRIHTGEEEEKEYRIFRDFLPSRNAGIVYELTGSENYE